MCIQLCRYQMEKTYNEKKLGLGFRLCLQLVTTQKLYLIHNSLSSPLTTPLVYFCHAYWPYLLARVLGQGRVKLVLRFRTYFLPKQISCILFWCGHILMSLLKHVRKIDTCTYLYTRQAYIISHRKCRLNYKYDSTTQYSCR